MPKLGKRYSNNAQKVNRAKKYRLEDAVTVLKGMTVPKFDETIDLSLHLGVDPKHADQMVRGSVLLPHGTGRTVRVLVIAKGEKEKEAKDAGADFVGAEDMIEKIKGGWLDFDKLIATPDMMGAVGKLGSILGPKGLMPNPKVGTVTFEVGKAVKDVRKGKVDFKVDKAGNVHTLVGKMSFAAEQIRENVTALMESIVKAKPATSKGLYLRSITISPTMGPGIRLDAAAFMTGEGGSHA
ncbi:MAG TPA: 50S ribosomal protein L1 [Bdellovibrionota bacterium]|nr:50S ribosomal protein L1 [Bdellovibrionota bacterium]